MQLLQLYTLWNPILDAHWRHLISIYWPEDGRNVYVGLKMAAMYMLVWRWLQCSQNM